MSRAKGFQVDHVGFTRYATGRSVRRHMRMVGEHWKDRVAANARTSFSDRSTGDYVNSLDVEFNDRTLGKPTPLRRTGVVVVARVRYAAILEYGARGVSVDVRKPPQPLTTTLDEMHAADPRGGKPRG